MDTEIATAMWAQGQSVVNDARAPCTHTGSSSGRKPPKGPDGLLTAGTSGESGDAAYWQARQDALGLITHGKRLEPDEVVFCERLARIHPDIPLHEQIEWLPDGQRINGKTQPSNDFIWLSMGGIEVELKSTGSPTSITTRIWKAVNQAWVSNGFVKENFVVDIGDLKLTDDLRNTLAGYNLSESGRPVKRIFVMWQRRIEEITLN